MRYHIHHHSHTVDTDRLSIEVEIEVGITPGDPGCWETPPTPPEAEFRAVRVTRVEIGWDGDRPERS